MKLSRAAVRIVPLWLCWLVLLLCFQVFSTSRFQIKRPDVALSWTASETGRTSQNDQPYLIEPLFNRQVSWDSEFYLSIALSGYEDPIIRTVPAGGEELSLNYAFYPLYPWVLRSVSIPLSRFDISPIAAASLAGIIVSSLGALAGAMALYDLLPDNTDDTESYRSALYFLIFPSAVFLAQVYTEGLFTGLAFTSLAFGRRRRFFFAGLLAALATWTRPVGAALALPLGIMVLQEVFLHRQVKLRSLILPALATLLPIAAYAAWKISPLGVNWTLVEENFFGRSMLDIPRSFDAWREAALALSGTNRQAAAYYGVEFFAILLGLLCPIILIRRRPAIALFSLAMAIIPLTSGVAQGMHRYILAAPAVFMTLARAGKSRTFDRAWSLGSVLLLAVFAMLFSFDMWAG